MIGPTAGLPPREMHSPTTGVDAGAVAVADRRLRGWRAPALAAAAAIFAALPGLLAIPVLDRDEGRLAQASAQMLQSGDVTEIRFQEEPRETRSVGFHWLQAVSTAALSSAEARDIRPYRLPSLLGAALAAAACAWGATAFWGAARGALAGALLGASFLLSTSGAIGLPDAALCGATTLALAALGRLYAEARGGASAGGAARTLLWIGVGAGLMLKGPVTPMVLGSTLAALAAIDRDARWMRGLGWGWGLAGVALACGPWAAAITVSTDGGVWWRAFTQDAATRLVGVGRLSPPGFHAALAPLLVFPGSLLLPAAAVAAWRGRGETGIRFALAWLVPGWLLSEVVPVKLPHDALPVYGAVTWLCAAALPVTARARGAATAGAALGLATATGAAVAGVLCAGRFGGTSALAAAAVGGALAVAAGLAGGTLLLLRRPWAATLTAGAAGLCAHGVLAAALVPRLDALWLSRRAATLVAESGLDPRNGVTPGPLAVAGYAEPSLVFLLGGATEFDTADDAAQALAAGQPAFVEIGEEPGFRAALLRFGAVARSAGRVAGYDYAAGRKVTLVLWRPKTAGD